MDQTFELLSTMSPKVKGRQKTVKQKKASILALKKNIKKTIGHNTSLNISTIDLISDSSPDDSDDVISLSSSDSQDKNDKHYFPLKNVTDQYNNKCITKVESWLDNVAIGTKNETLFSQISTIYGDNIDTREDKTCNVAVCSSFKEEDNFRFHELFIDKKRDKALKRKEEKENLEAIVIDRSWQESSSDSYKTCSDSKTLKSVKSNSPATPSNKKIEEAASLLDTIYGKKWREKQDEVLKPLSESKKKPVAKKTATKINREKISTNNPPKNVNSVGKPLNFAKLKMPTESPWLKKLEGLVDSESDDETAKKQPVRIKLNFDEEEEKRFKTPKAVAIKKNVQDSTDSSSSTANSSDEEYNKNIELIELKRQSRVLPTNITYSFLESLSGSIPLEKCDASARVFRTCYKEKKEQLAKKLFTLFNENVFKNGLPEDMQISWKTTLRKTAGLCRCTKSIHRNGNITRKAHIELSIKVLDSADRLRDTLIHEMCHAATWIINKISAGHGPLWKHWALKAMQVFPELPSINICHSYTINAKYTYKCTGCGYSIARHSKSLDTDRKRCGYCYGKFEILLNKIMKNGETKSVPASTRKEPSAFALFVKSNYAVYKDPTKSHGDVMKVLGQKFAEMKVNTG